MRPVPGVADNHPGGGGDDALATPTPAPISCFITTEAAIEASSANSSPPQFRPTFPRRKRSLESTSHPTRSRQPSPTPTRDSITSLSSTMLDSELGQEMPQDRSPYAAQGTPAGLSGSASVISSAASAAYPGNSMAPASPRRRGRSAAPSSDWQSRREAAPQLVMPRLAVPQRRPFSEAGKSVGKLRVLVAGQSGIGKTSLVQAIAHICEHIVHIDPVASTSHNEFSEMWASTKPRQWWQAESMHGSSRRRRRSSTGEVLDRNLCFVVKSPFQQSPSHMAERNYVEDLLSPLLDKPMEDSDLWNIISGGGLSIVDAVLYMIPHTGLEVRDIECIKSLQDKTNIIPLLARSDELDADSISSAKDVIRQQIAEHGLDCFSFTTPDSDPDITDVFSVSSATVMDHDEMDASVLMSSGYVQPLVKTDLGRLVQQVFSMDGSAWLRHCAATKCVQWRREQDHGLGLQMALMHRDPAKCALSPVLTVNPFVQHRYWSRVEVSNWAQGLRHSLETETLHRLAQQRLAAEAHRQQRSGDLVRRPWESSGRRRGGEQVNLVHQDPLGILPVLSQLKRNGQLTFEFLSSLGLVGCVATWLAGPEWACRRGLRHLPQEVLAWIFMI